MRPGTQNQTPIKPHLWFGYDIIKGRKPPACAVEQESVVAQMIVVIRHENIEHHAAEQFMQVAASLRAVLAQNGGKIGIAVSADFAFVRAQYGQA